MSADQQTSLLPHAAVASARASTIRTPDGYHLRPITLSDSYTFKYDDKGKVISSRPPGILMGDWYRNNAGEWRHIDWDLERGDALRIEADPKYGPLYWLSAPDNYEWFLAQNSVSPLYKNILSNYALWFREVFQVVGIRSMLLKMGAQSLDQSKYKTAGLAYRERVVQRVPLADPMAALSASLCGRPTYTEEESYEERFVPMDDQSIQLQSTYRLYSQQTIGAAALLAAKRYALFKDMRTGKTYTALTAARVLLTSGQAQRLFVVCPVSNMYDPWAPACRMYGLQTHVLDGTEDEDIEALRDPKNEVIILNYERVPLRLTSILQETQGAFIVVPDETSAIKNPTAKRSRATHRLCWASEWCWLLNGTPCEQGPQDIWSQTACLDPYGFLWGATYTSYVNQWLALGRGGQTVVKPDLRASWESLLSMMSIRYIRSEADQFLGKDKTFRYIKVPPTLAQVTDTTNVLAGLTTNRETGEFHDVTAYRLAQLTHLREICNGYNKYPIGVKQVGDKEQIVYCRQQYELDAKVLWLRAFLEANPSQHCVVFCEYTEQEQMVKDMMDDIQQTYGSTRPSMTLSHVKCLAKNIPQSAAAGLAREFFYQDSLPGIGFALPGQDIQLPDWLRFDERFIQWMEQHHPGYVSTTHEYVDRGTYAGEVRAAQIQKFQHAEVQHFILKTSQGRGLTLNMQPALHEGRASPPCIIFMNPPWSLGMYQQAQDRCVGVSPEGVSYCNMVYNLFIQGSIEERVLEALRAKKEVQEVLLKDIERSGFESFTNDILADMQKAVEDKTVFDTEEMLSRIRLGLSPLTKLTVSVIDRAARTKFQLSKTAVLEDSLSPEGWAAVCYLRSLVA